MKIAISADTLLGVAASIPGWVREHGHQVTLHGALDPQDNAQWAFASAAAAREVAQGRADQAIVCCTTGTGATLAANKLTGVRAALCADAYTAAGARKWNDANTLGISLRLTSESEIKEMLDAWFAAEVDSGQKSNIDYIRKLEAEQFKKLG